MNLIAEIVHNQVVRNTHHPMDELVLVLVITAVDGVDHLIERVLENVVGHRLVLNHGQNVAIDLGLIPFEQNVEASNFPVPVTKNQLVVAESACCYCHNNLLFLRVRNDSAASIVSVLVKLMVTDVLTKIAAKIHLFSETE